MESITRAWRLATIAWSVILADKELIFYPVLSGVTLILLFSVMIVPFYLVELFGSTGLTMLLGFVFYLCAHIIIHFFNSALVSSALVRLKGGDPTLKTGFRIALRRFVLILKWSLVAATIGILLNFIKQRAGWMGSLFGGFLEIGWNIISYFVIPVMVVEGIQPMDAITRSKNLIKKTWGEQLTATFGFGMLSFLLAVPAIFIFLILIPFFSTPMFPMLIMFAYLMGVMLVMTTMSGIFQAALYLFAREGKITGYFDESDIRDAFAPDQNR